MSIWTNRQRRTILIHELNIINRLSLRLSTYIIGCLRETTQIGIQTAVFRNKQLNFDFKNNLWVAIAQCNQLTPCQPQSMMAYAFLTWVVLLMLLRVIAYETVQDAGEPVCMLTLSVAVLDLSYCRRLHSNNITTYGSTLSKFHRHNGDRISTGSSNHGRYVIAPKILT